MLQGICYAYLQAEQFAEGIARLLSHAKRHWENRDASPFLVNIGRLLLSAGELENALSHFRRAIELDRKQVEAHFGLVDALATSGDAQALYAAIEQAQLDCGRTFLLHNHLGALYNDQLDDSPTALAHFLVAQSIEPENPIVLNNLGITYVALENFDLAIESLTSAIAMDPDYVNAYWNLCIAQYQSDRFRDAIETASDALKRFPASENADNFHALRGDAAQYIHTPTVSLQRLREHDGPITDSLAVTLARDIAEEHYPGFDVGNAAHAGETIGSSVAIYGVSLDDAWIIYLRSRIAMGLGGSTVVVVDRKTGLIRYHGTINDEG
jgi:tetratricopeptide (TPR) repeat protein